MTVLGHDKITNIDDLEPEDQHNSYPAAIYTMNLLQAGGFTTKYYRSKEGTQETINRTAFVMSTGHLQALDVGGGLFKTFSKTSGFSCLLS